MTIFSINTAEFAWSFTIAMAWIIGEFGYRFTKLPRISIYGLVGFLAANSPLEFLSHLDGNMLLLPANIAFGLILFEFGYHINIRWLKCNPWIGITGLAEAIATFIAIYALTQWLGMSTFLSLSIAALAMATSPASVLRVINEQRSSGQVTERILHLSALNCVLAVIVFNVIVAFWVSHTSSNFYQAPINSVIMLITSIVLGFIFGIILPVMLRYLGNLAQDATIAFALSVILLIAIAHAAKLSPILAALTFGLTARHRRITLSHTKRNFGALGDLLTVMLFVFVASTLEWQRVVAGAGLGFMLIVVRLGMKTLATTVFAPISGIPLRKGILTGIGLAPVSVFVIMTLVQARYSGLALVDELTNLEALVAMTLILELISPVLTKFALVLAGETQEKSEK
ncbi:MAG: sodium:proton antiporter [Solimicrobium sp.]|jgi:Kef-type K+ transport system membrane component KefB|nr:sodium:proton antiporter [Solimicrobium sp.]